jgi:asparagine synthase (glutamine-hydrolysing)
MCGINGLLRLSPGAPTLDRAELLRVRDAMASRGPDGEGEWCSDDGRIAFGHRRLAIIDLSESGRQPMQSADGRLVIVFNGEIYNHRELRVGLESHGVRFRSTSDTEVILALYGREGRAGLARLRGMFALALWDAREERLVLARDPWGIKPLYYAVDAGVLRFASQLRALEASGALSREVSAGGLAGFLLWGAVPEPLTIRRAIKAVPAGHSIEISAGCVGAPCPLPEAPVPPTRPEEAVEDSVAAHLVSDVPVGVFLSAGLDSALVAALASRHLAEPPVTLTLAFETQRGTPRDEAPLAAEVARLLGTRHVERRFSTADVDGLRAQALVAMDQPSVDGLNTFLVSRAARDAGLKVVLSGLGGDELFGSYPSFRDVPRWLAWARRGARIPGLCAAWPRLAALAAPGRPKLCGLLRYGGSLAGAYFLRRGLFLPEELPALLGRELAAAGLAEYDAVAAAEAAAAPQRDAPLEAWPAIHRLESRLYLRNQLLRDADWASMAHSLEVRVPLVDGQLHGILERADFEPARISGKAHLVRRLAPGLPEALYARPKTGFVVPTGAAGAPMGLASRALARQALAAFVCLPGLAPA